MGLIRFIGDSVSDMIRLAEPDQQLTVAILLILWVSAFASAFIDNIPYTTTMIPVILQLSDEPGLTLPLLPLAWV
jgi:P protein